jgi:hypothetical protein
MPGKSKYSKTVRSFSSTNEALAYLIVGPYIRVNNIYDLKIVRLDNPYLR